MHYKGPPGGDELTALKESAARRLSRLCDVEEKEKKMLRDVDVDDVVDVGAVPRHGEVGVVVEVVG